MFHEWPGFVHDAGQEAHEMLRREPRIESLAEPFPFLSLEIMSETQTGGENVVQVSTYISSDDRLRSQ